MLSQTLGTALGDWSADTADLGYEGAAVLFGSTLAVVALLYWRTVASRTALFWAAFILTRPLGAVLGEFIDKPIATGGLELSRFVASVALIGGIVRFVCCRSALRPWRTEPEARTRCACC